PDNKGFKATKQVWVTVLLILLLQMLFTYVPFFNGTFETSDIKLVHWVFIISAGVVLFAVW
ncbi:MAG: cation transporting ATPase C-terminal domain-containing protein, partial [Bacteroidota bacterium]